MFIHFAGMVWAHLSSDSEKSWKINTKLLWPITPILRRNISHGSGFLQHDSAFIHRAQGFTGWFDEDINDVSHKLWSSHSTDLYPVEHPWKVLQWHVRQCSPIIIITIISIIKTNLGTIVWKNGVNCSSTVQCAELMPLLCSHTLHSRFIFKIAFKMLFPPIDLSPICRYLICYGMDHFYYKLTIFVLLLKTEEARSGYQLIFPIFYAFDFSPSHS